MDHKVYMHPYNFLTIRLQADDDGSDSVVMDEEKEFRSDGMDRCRLVLS